METQMSEGERVASWFILLCIVGLGSLIYLDSTVNERMAKLGYQPKLIEGSNQVFWWKPVARPPIVLPGL